MKGFKPRSGLYLGSLSLLMSLTVLGTVGLPSASQSQTADSNLYCWGLNNSGQLGLGTCCTDQYVPAKAILPSGKTHYKQVSTGYRGTCAITNDDQLYCWGWGALGEVGHGANANPVSTPTAVVVPSGVTAWSKVSVGQIGHCALATNGRVYCWGEGQRHRLGTGSTANVNVPTQVPFPGGVTAFTDVSAGNHSCAIGNDGNAYCWGLNNSGQIGDGTCCSDKTSPTLVIKPGGVTSYTKISASYRTTCALANTGDIYCWGWGRYGEIGNGGAFGDFYSPQQVVKPSGVSAYTDVMTMTNAMCGLGNNGRAYCWGYGGWRMRGDNSEVNTSTPQPVALPVSPSGVTSYSGMGYNRYEGQAASFGSCLIGNDSNAYCWSQDASGRLGNDAAATDWRTVMPVKVAMPVTTPVVQISSGNHVCAITSYIPPSPPVVSPPSCVGESKNWTVTGQTCTASLGAAAHGEFQTITDNGAPTVGNKTYECVSGSWVARGTETCALSSYFCYPPPVNGVCMTFSGTYPSQPAPSQGSGCLSGDYQDTADDSSYFRWQCNGRFGGTPSSCSAAIQPACPPPPANCPANGSISWTVSGNTCYGSAPATVHSADTPVVSDVSGTPIGNATFNCNSGSFTVNAGATCSPAPIGGACVSYGSTYGSQPAYDNATGCTQGSYIDAADDGTYWRWTCTGQYGGGDSTCAATKSPPPPPPPPGCTPDGSPDPYYSGSPPAPPPPPPSCDANGELDVGNCCNADGDGDGYCGGFGGGGSCFTGDTPITLADGTQKLIKDIVAGDMVMAFELMNPTSDLIVRPVNAVIEFKDKEVLVINGTIKVTESHKFPVLGSVDVKPAGELLVGDQLIAMDGSPVAVTSVEKLPGLHTVYNFEVDDQHTYIAHGIRTNNMVILESTKMKIKYFQQHIIPAAKV